MNKTVTNALIKAVISLHKAFKESRKNRKKQREKPEERVWQGRGRSLSSVFEFETANKLSEVYPEYYFLVDYPISIYKRETWLRTIYPDILVLKNLNVNKIDKCEVVAMIDLKIDLGWVDINDYKSKKFAQREKEKRDATNCRFKYIVNAVSEEEKKSNKEIGKLKAKIPSKNKLKKIFIICSKMNHPERAKEFQALLKKNGGYKVLFLLDKHLHPNILEEKSESFKKHIQQKEAAIEKVFRGL